jgi:hypothetical protein
MGDPAPPDPIANDIEITLPLAKETPYVTAFAPADPTDSRALLEWRSKYDAPEAQRGIRFEALYMAVLFALVPVLMILLWLEYPRTWFAISQQKYHPIEHYGLAWLSGLLGGTVLDVKWLYHSVARQIWHLDRRLWRLFIPHVSGATAFAVTALIGSGMIRVFDARTVDSLPLVIGLGFLVGYFSDFAIAKLFELAETLFGASRTPKTELRRGITAKSSR